VTFLHKVLAVFSLVAVCAPLLAAKDAPQQVLVWPESGPQLVRFELGKFERFSWHSGENQWQCEVVATNLWTKPIKLADFAVYFFDKSKVRIGEGYMQVSELPAGQRAKFQLNVSTSGMPTSLVLQPRRVPPEFQSFMPTMPARTISLTVNTVPQGATFNLDGSAMGTTPKRIDISSGQHLLTFSMMGYAPGNYPFEVKPEDVSGGSITVELGGMMHDTVQLRDGSVLTGDVESLSPTAMEIRIAGTIQKVDRNQISKILLIQREVVQ